MWSSDPDSDYSDQESAARHWDWSTAPPKDEQIIGWRHVLPEFSFWTPASELLPVGLEPVIVFGILEGETQPDRHEAFLVTQTPIWSSVRSGEGMGSPPYFRITSVTHWMPMPPAPSPTPVEPIHATTSATSWHTQPPINPVSQVNPDQTTFEVHGHTWTRHTPGNPCPVPAQTKVIVLLRRELLSPAARDEIRMAGLYAWGSFNGETWEIIGWRYATPPAASPTAPPHPPASADDTPHSSAPASAPPAPSPAP